MTTTEDSVTSARALRAHYRDAEGGSGRLRLLEKAAAAFAEESSLRSALNLILGEGVRFLGGDSGVILTLEDGGLTVVACHGEVLPIGARLPLGGVLGEVLRSPLRGSLREHVESRLRLGRRLNVAIELLLPLAVRGKVHGLLGLIGESRSQLPSEDDLRSLRALGTLIGLALQGATPSRTRAQRRDASALLGQLTPREQQVFALLPRGLTNAEIAAQLGIAAGTAKIHVERILHKLGVSDRTQAAVRASECGLRA